MSKVCIFGAGGFAKEVFWLSQQCGYEVDAFIDVHAGGECCGIRIEDESYFDSAKHQAVVAIGSPKLREKIVNQIIAKHGEHVFKTLVHPKANLMDTNVVVGYGSVICANCILTCDIQLGPWSQLNLSSTIGHDVKTGAFFTTAPGVHISGKVIAGNRVYLGTNASTVEDISICDDVTIGAAGCVSKDILESGT
jgi:sugar O-acyltransferase (sialic acid O-acetyltransferase NeuD family)